MQLAEKIPELWFLVLVRLDDIELAKNAVFRYGISNRSTVMHVTEPNVGQYLSASDMALFLRHKHMMNNIVTTGKLSEYLFAGLPVISTRANADVLNQLIDEMNAGVFINDSLYIDNNLVKSIQALKDNTAKISDRLYISHYAAQRFTGPNDPFISYTLFIKKIIDN